ncbi:MULTISPECIES: hypothetical protein [Spirosoma]|uniref:Uncharacterized protein n=1 Tax=Spirosoma liriopis TaxID=2937440 RepID=A0ABT0HTH4_9BACT|nr:MULTISPECIES: hypothetical protein [Spirosoma]MCK8495497.1 hypothetical protein [Spirosoma liriopis]UHG94509.1 hypothetical protein LQ777_28385 [Spirosoma oryzicola]
MAHQDKKNKNTKKMATKPAKVAGQPVLPKYARNETVMTTPTVSPKVKKG